MGHATSVTETRSDDDAKAVRSGLLGGWLQPLGWSVGFLQSSAPAVVEALTSWRRTLGRPFERTTVDAPWSDGLACLTPLQTPWNRELLVAHGDDWTCYLNNSINGGDPDPVIGHLTRTLAVHGVLVTHQPRLAAGHASTQFAYLGPEGEMPLGYIRTLAAHAEDGRWSWHTCGETLNFEDTSRYTARRIRDRLDRTLLLEYLAQLGIHPDDPSKFGPATLVVGASDSAAKSMTLEQARSYWAAR